MTPPREPNVLFCFHGHSLHYDAPTFGGRTVVCGPFVQRRQDDERRRYIPCGSNASIAKLVEELNPEWRPDVVVVRVDASPFVRVDLTGIDCPVALLLGDTHHMSHPIQALIDYVSTCRYDYAFTYNNLRHAHFLHAAGIRNLRWAPGLLVTPFETALPESRNGAVCAIGNLLQTHIYRRRLVDEMFAAGLPVMAARMSARRAAEQYAQASVSFNCSLNGDLNMRVFEVTSSGGLLLTDRLSPMSGLDALFVEGRDYVAYDGPDDLIDKCRFYLDNPGEAAAIAASGRNVYWSSLAPAVLHPRLWRLLIDGVDNDTLSIDRDPRIASPASAAELRPRISIYEDAQEQHHRSVDFRVLAFPQVPRRHLEDISDLPRLRLSLIGGSAGLAPGSFVSAPVRVGPEALDQEIWSLMIVTKEEFQTSRFPDGAKLLICDADAGIDVLSNDSGRFVRLAEFQRVGLFESLRARPEAPTTTGGPLVHSLTTSLATAGPGKVIDTAAYTSCNVHVVEITDARISFEGSNNTIDWVTQTLTPVPVTPHTTQCAFVTSAGMFQFPTSFRYVRANVHEHSTDHVVISWCLKNSDLAAASVKIENAPYVLPANRSMFFETEFASVAAGQTLTGPARDVGVGPSSNCVWRSFSAIVNADQPLLVTLEGANDLHSWTAIERRSVGAGAPTRIDIPILARYSRLRIENTGSSASECAFITSFAT